jgi:hypothetical protein
VQQQKWLDTRTNLHKFSHNSGGSMGYARWTRYVVVARLAASSSRGVSGETKKLTSAMWMPTCILPLGRTLQDSASSKSLQFTVYNQKKMLR